MSDHLRLHSWKQQCAATSKQSGERCKKFAVPGCRTCHIHGSSTAAARAAGDRRMRQHLATQVAARLGMTVDVSPQQALLDAVSESAGVVAYWRAIVAELAPTTGGGMVELPDPAGWEAGETRLEWREGTSGPDHLGDQRLHVAVAAYNDARDALVRHARSAISGGCETAMVRIAAEQMDLVADAVRVVLARFGIDVTDPSVAKSVGEALREAIADPRAIEQTVDAVLVAEEGR